MLDPALIVPGRCHRPSIVEAQAGAGDARKISTAEDDFHFTHPILLSLTFSISHNARKYKAKDADCRSCSLAQTHYDAPPHFLQNTPPIGLFAKRCISG